MEYEESVSEEVVISELPSYDLPTKRQKTALENYEFKERDKDPKVEECKKEHPEKWEKITKKTNLSDDTTSSIVLGKGKISGEFYFLLICLYFTFFTKEISFS